MTLSDKDREKLLDYLSTMSDDELAGFVDEASQSARFNPDVREKQMIGLQYAKGTRGGREIYDRDKAAAAESLSEIGSFVAAEKEKRALKYKDDKIEPNRASNREGIFGIRDDADEDGLSLQEVVEKRVEEQNTIAASDDNQLQRELDGINPEAMQAAREDRDRASQKSDERKERNDRAYRTRMDREADQELADAEDQMLTRSLSAESAAEQGPDLQKEAMALFPKIMGSSFDPNSSMDRGKLEILMQAKRDYPDLSPNQLALKIYRDYM